MDGGGELRDGGLRDGASAWVKANASGGAGRVEGNTWF